MFVPAAELRSVDVVNGSWLKSKVTGRAVDAALYAQVSDATLLLVSFFMAIALTVVVASIENGAVYRVLPLVGVVMPSVV